jgi:hypothetical protein
MVICHIFKMECRYTNMDWWSIISDLLNVFTDYNGLVSRVCLTKVKSLIKLLLYHIRIETVCFSCYVVAGDLKYTNWNTTIQMVETVVAETFLLNRML